MKFLSLEPFVPSGKNFEDAKQFFQELGFKINWDAGEYVGFQRNECRFVLQKFDNVEFAQNFMLSVKVTNVEEFRQDVIEKKLPEKFGIRIGQISQQPYGKEVNIIDIAGVCWLPEKFGIRIGQISQQPYGKEVNIIDIAGVCWHFVEQ